MVTEITQGIKVSVETFFQSGHSIIASSHFVFAYRVTIENDSENTIQLLKRHWLITDACGNKREVDGEGVVGEQPLIRAGKKYQYVSACDFETEIGKMRGTYLMKEQKSGKELEVIIPEFLMTVPYKVN